MSPNGRSVYVAQTSSGGDVLQYNVDDGGALAFKNPPAVDADFLPLDVAVNHVNFHYDVTVELGVSETPQCLSQDYALEPGTEYNVRLCARDASQELGVRRESNVHNRFVRERIAIRGGKVAQLPKTAIGPYAIRCGPRGGLLHGCLIRAGLY